jgi:hypothetical protein
LVNTPEGSGGAAAVEGRQLKKMEAARTTTTAQVRTDLCMKLKSPEQLT